VYCDAMFLHRNCIYTYIYIYSLPSPSLHSISRATRLYQGPGHSAAWRLSEVAVDGGAHHIALTVVTAVVVVVPVVVTTMVVESFSPPSPLLTRPRTCTAANDVCVRVVGRREWCTVCKTRPSFVIIIIIIIYL